MADQLDVLLSKLEPNTVYVFFYGPGSGINQQALRKETKLPANTYVNFIPVLDPTNIRILEAK